ncbi:hypothetical protein, partial [Deinococcus sp. GbtcB9]|uniref:hypothetical protein n=1 Tax=Deinococcus sp. GbtcB9 TaxID=2824754 RepID=UPI001C2F100E
GRQFPWDGSTGLHHHPAPRNFRMTSTNRRGIDGRGFIRHIAENWMNRWSTAGSLATSTTDA